MYQDNISALLGAGQDPKEQQLAQALRGQQAGGDMLGLSTIGQVSALGQNINARTNAAAKQAGGLKKAMQDRQARKESEMAAREERNAAAKLIADRRVIEHNDTMGLKQAVEQRQVKDDYDDNVDKKEKAKFKRLKLDTTSDEKKSRLGFDTSRFLSEFELDNKQFDYKKDYDAAKLDQGNMKIANAYEINKGKLGVSQDKLTEMERQFGVRHDGIMTRHQADSVLKWAEFDWDKDEFGMKRTDDQKSRMRRAYEFDVKTAEERAMFNESLGFRQGSLDAQMERHADKMDNEASKLAYSLVGNSKSKKKNGMNSRTARHYEDIASEATGMLSPFESYVPEYASQTILSGKATTFAADIGLTPLMPEGMQDRAGWWKTYKKFNILPERHEMFGAALTAPEIAAWNGASISENDSDYTIRKNLAFREAFIRDKMAKFGGNALEAGASDSWVLRNYGDLINGERFITPAEGDPLNSTENSEVETSATSELDAWKAELAELTGGAS